MNENKKAVLIERDYKGIFERYALTPDEFKEEFSNHNIPEPTPGGEGCTLEPLVHMWYAETEVGSELWKTFFTDMEWGLSEGDKERRNLAYIRHDFMQSLRPDLLDFLVGDPSRYWIFDLDQIDMDCVLQYEELLGRQLTGYNEYSEIDGEVDEMILDWEDADSFFKAYPQLEKYRAAVDTVKSESLDDMIQAANPNKKSVSIIDQEVRDRYSTDTGKVWGADEEHMAKICSFFDYGFNWNDKGNIVINNDYAAGTFLSIDETIYSFHGVSFQKMVDGNILLHFEYESAEDMVRSWEGICREMSLECERQGVAKPFDWIKLDNAKQIIHDIER